MEIRITPYRGKNKGELTMKKYVFMLLILCGLLAINGPAMAWTPGGAEDTFLASADVADSDEAEVAWVNSFLNTTFTTADLTKYDTTPMIWQWTDSNGSNGVYAIEFDTKSPGYFYISLGTSDSLTTQHFLYENIDDLAWGVINLGALSDIGFTNVEIGKISSIGELGGTTQVPEPSLLLLLGAGLVGIGAATWRKIK
jgi:hypothetical protein